ncbi:MAG: GNAT family N-acetyltransferase [Microlunatus sp.]|nr:GNAT family N-acetyltransferase [Microlunatus sp.]
MADRTQSVGSAGPARGFPDAVPILLDPVAKVTLRAHSGADVSAIIEQCRDPEMRRWVPLPEPPGGYAEPEAREFLARIRMGWQQGESYAWAIEVGASRSGPAVAFAGGIDLRRLEAQVAEVGFGLHPAARGRQVMTSALRLVRDYGLDTLGYRAIRWRALVGNWASRRVAAAAGFRFDGTVRASLDHHGEARDSWWATIRAEDARLDLSWPDPPRLTGTRMSLRPFRDSDLERVVESCVDPDTQHWLVSLPRLYRRRDAEDYLAAVRESAATRSGWAWCVAEAGDRCLGAISLEGFGGYARRLEIGYWTHPDARGRGIAAEAVRLVTAHVEDNDLADSVTIRCAASNRASRRVAEAAGYNQIGVQPRCEPLRDGTLADLVSYSRP